MRTINDIIPPSRRSTDPTLPEPQLTSPVRPRERSRFPFMTLGIVLVIIAAAAAALYYFSTARVEVTPNTVSAAVQSSFTATQSTGDLPYEIVTSQKTASQSVKSSGSKQVSSSAEGIVTLYNTQSKAQKLIANTRLATTAGLIFRIHSAVTIPAGTSAAPGSISVKVYADKPGDIYDVAPTEFSIPGFAGTPLSSEVTARSKSAMTGGASGAQPIIDTALEDQTRSALASALTSDLATSLKGQVPEGYTLLPGAATTTYAALASAPSATTGMVDVKEQGTITAVVFPSASLASAVARSVSALGYHDESVTLLPASSLSLSATALPSATDTSFSFILTGTAGLGYVIDPTRIAAAVAGKSRSAAEVALTNYPEVKRAVIILRPFWRSTFPQDPSAISVTVANP